MHEVASKGSTVKVAMTIWEGRISPVLDTARALVVADIDGGGLVSQRSEELPADSGHEKVARLRALGVEVLVCGAVSRPLADLVTASGIRLVPFVSGEFGEVMDAVIAGGVPSKAFSMPGCGCGRGRRLRARRGRCGPAQQREVIEVRPTLEKK
ncbi:MAG TPA: NifB/NifX family molybdenum-iron cluster-binding protein [Candidatus Hydrogenedentes bacterium]|nr:NifB/NifX family molybdenum-iron cluster-binding protein [Candidatus Hydrogenedentota bacterium]HNT89932.1 NifB/NifX family molybdenum-iron cluster-binding protein [Candidatus Hydrogenedentota bacterium]